MNPTSNLTKLWSLSRSIPEAHLGAYPRTDRRRASASDLEKTVQLVRLTSATADRRRPRTTGHDEIVQVVRFFPQERLSERIIEHIVDVLIPQFLEEIVELVRSMSATADRRAIVDVPLPQKVKTMSRFSTRSSRSEFLRVSVNRSLSNLLSCGVVVTTLLSWCVSECAAGYPLSMCASVCRWCMQAFIGGSVQDSNGAETSSSTSGDGQGARRETETDHNGSQWSRRAQQKES